MNTIDWKKVRGVYPIYDDRLVMFIMEYGREVGMKIPAELDFFNIYDKIKAKVHKVEAVPFKLYDTVKYKSLGRGIRILCVETGKEYKSASELCRVLGFNYNYRSEVMRKIRKGKAIKGRYYEILS